MGQKEFNFSTAPPEALYKGYTWKLIRLVSLRQNHFTELNENGLRLLDRSIFGALMDCRENGFEQAAHEILDKYLPEGITACILKPKDRDLIGKH